MNPFSLGFQLQLLTIFIYVFIFFFSFFFFAWCLKWESVINIYFNNSRTTNLLFWGLKLCLFLYSHEAAACQQLATAGYCGVGMAFGCEPEPPSVTLPAGTHTGSIKRRIQWKNHYRAAHWQPHMHPWGSLARLNWKAVHLSGLTPVDLRIMTGSSGRLTLTLDTDLSVWPLLVASC